VEGDVRILGAVDEGRLEELYAAATVVVTATVMEGFGLPVLEALGRAVPVVCSDLPVLREVAGEAALWVDPHEPASIAAGLRRALSGGSDVDRLRDLGRARAQLFSWRAAAEQTFQVYERAVAGRRG